MNRRVTYELNSTFRDLMTDSAECGRATVRCCETGQRLALGRIGRRRYNQDREAWADPGEMDTGID